MSFACHLDVICMRSYLSLCTLMSPVCHSFVLVYHPYVPRMYSYTIHMSLVCTRVPSVCHSYVRVCHPYFYRMYPYVTRMYSYVIRMSLVCTRMSSVCYSYVALQWTITIRTNLYLQMFAPRNLQYCSVKWKSYLKHLSWHLTQFWQVLPLSWSMSHP